MENQPIYPDLRGASVLVTGGGSGIGAALTEGFLRQGSRVAFVQRSDGSSFCDKMDQEVGNRPLYISCDITDVSKLKNAISLAAQVHGTINVLINNAACDDRHQTESTSEGDWDSLISINLKSYFFATQAVVCGMKEAGSGSIINLTSISYIMGNAEYPVYVAANSGINGMTRAHAREFGPYNIRVNALAPGWVLTEKQRRKWATPEAIDAHVARQCIKKTIRPCDIVGGALFLASDASQMMTGQALVIDGGVVATG
jgi:galactose dehydrogenase